MRSSRESTRVPSRSNITNLIEYGSNARLTCDIKEEYRRGAYGSAIFDAGTSEWPPACQWFKIIFGARGSCCPDANAQDPRKIRRSGGEQGRQDLRRSVARTAHRGLPVDVHLAADR